MAYINMQEASSPLMNQLMFFHDHTLFILIIITIIVKYMMSMLFFNLMISRFVLEN